MDVQRNGIELIDLWIAWFLYW